MKDIKKSHEVILFPEDKTINIPTTQEVLICEDNTWVLISHGGESFSMSIENATALHELMNNALQEALIQNHKHHI